MCIQLAGVRPYIHTYSKVKYSVAVHAGAQCTARMYIEITYLYADQCTCECLSFTCTLCLFLYIETYFIFRYSCPLPPPPFFYLLELITRLFSFGVSYDIMCIYRLFDALRQVLSFFFFVSGAVVFLVSRKTNCTAHSIKV